MLLTIRWSAVIFGTAAGALATAATTLLAWPLLATANVAQAPLAALSLSLLVGFAIAGMVGGRLSGRSPRFHGMVAAFGLASLVVVISLLGGSPAPTGQILILVALATVFGGIGGTVAGRRPKPE